MEEDQAARRARKKAGGNTGKRYTEGWVEFENKKVAKGEAQKWLFIINTNMYELKRRGAPFETSSCSRWSDWASPRTVCL